MEIQDETSVKAQNLEFIQKLLMIGAYIDITKFCMRRCQLTKDFSTSEISEQENECLSTFISPMRQQ